MRGIAAAAKTLLIAEGVGLGLLAAAGARAGLTDGVGDHILAVDVDPVERRVDVALRVARPE